MPIISIIMAVFNGHKHLKEAIDSILNQTFKNYEFIIIDDGSYDSSIEIIKNYQSIDNKIILIENNENIGLAASLNKGIDAAKGKYIARMDADDISESNRFQEQYDFLESNPNIDLIGCQLTIIDQDSNYTNEIWRYKTEWQENEIISFFESPLPHPAIMMRSEIFKNNNLKYNINYKVAQDYDLWARLIPNHKIANINNALLRYRISRTKINPIRQELTNKIRYNQIIDRLGIQPTKEEWMAHMLLCKQYNETNFQAVVHIKGWIKKFHYALKSKKFSHYNFLYHYLIDNNIIEQIYRLAYQKRHITFHKAIYDIFNLNLPLLLQYGLSIRLIKDFLSKRK